MITKRTKKEDWVKLPLFLKEWNIENFQIDQQIITGEIENLILNTVGVINLIDLKISPRAGFFKNRRYSSIRYSVKRHLDRGYLYPPPGGIFEIRYPNDDIKGKIM